VIRQKLQDAHKDWKVPGERRVAKFAKRQHSFKKEKSGIFRMFKGSSSKEDGDHNSLLESHPIGRSKSEDSSMSGGSEKQRKGIRQSMNKLFSPAGKRRKSTKSEKNEVADEDRSVFRAISEIEESAHYQVDPDDYDILSPAARLYTIQPMLSPAKEEDEAEEIVTPITKDTEEEMTPEDKPDEIVMQPRLLEDAYLDDNDGKKGACDCEGCIIL
jgi:hypothetical protein